jgi:hypothetical protein
MVIADRQIGIPGRVGPAIHITATIDRDRRPHARNGATSRDRVNPIDAAGTIETASFPAFDVNCHHAERTLGPNVDWESFRDHIPPICFGYRLGGSGPGTDASKNLRYAAATCFGVNDIGFKLVKVDAWHQLLDLLIGVDLLLEHLFDCDPTGDLRRDNRSSRGPDEKVSIVEIDSCVLQSCYHPHLPGDSGWTASSKNDHSTSHTNLLVRLNQSFISGRLIPSRVIYQTNSTRLDSTLEVPSRRLVRSFYGHSRIDQTNGLWSVPKGETPAIADVAVTLASWRCLEFDQLTSCLQIRADGPLTGYTAREQPDIASFCSKVGDLRC